jgi:hypothetical protein
MMGGGSAAPSTRQKGVRVTLKSTIKAFAEEFGIEPEFYPVNINGHRNKF